MIPKPIHLCSYYRKLAKASHTDVLALNGGLGGTETQTNILVPPALFPIVSCRSMSRFIYPNISEATHATLARAPGLALGDKRDVRLLLESTLRLNGQLGSHFCGCLNCRSRRVIEGGFGDVC